MKNKILIFGMVVSMLASGVQVFAEEEDIMLINEDSEVEFVKDGSPIQEESIVVEKEFKAEDFKYFYNNLGEKINPEDIKEGDEIITYKEDGKGIAVVLMLEDTYSASDLDYYKKSDSFGDVVNLKNDLALHLGSEEIKIENADGEEIKDISADDLDGSLALVFCTAVTMSIPAQTTPEKIVILEQTNEEEIKKEISVNISADKIVKKDGFVMIPVREAVEGLGYEVGWKNEERKVTIGTVQMGVNFVVGENKYYKSKMMPFTLESAPELINELTYVPASFFEEVLWAEVKTADDGSITITIIAENID